MDTPNGALTTNDKARSIISVDAGLRTEMMVDVVDSYGRDVAVAALREAQVEARKCLDAANPREVPDVIELAAAIAHRWMTPSLKPVFNLTGTVLHTNLGRASLPRAAMRDVLRVGLGNSNLEYDLEEGRRGDRDSHLETLIQRLTGAEAATVVNNNAAAMFLVLNTLALGREVPISRGEMIEIGDSFRLPELIVRSGCRLHEIGTTNRTHLRDYANAIGPDTGVLLKIHTSNYEVRGFTKSVGETELAELGRSHGIPLVFDLGSGSIVDLRDYGLPHEPTPAEALKAGADIVTFSGDKLLGGPQAGLIVGRKDLIQQIKRNPLKRALRVDKMTIAALSSVLRLHLSPERLVCELPSLRFLTRPSEDIKSVADRLSGVAQAAFGPAATVSVEPCFSQIGSGALPADNLPSFALAIRPTDRKGGARRLETWAAALRTLPRPVIGRMSDGALLLDLRCVDDEKALAAQFAHLELRN